MSASEQLDQIIRDAEISIARIRALAAMRGDDESFAVPAVERRRLNHIAEDWSIDLKKLRNMRERKSRW